MINVSYFSLWCSLQKFLTVNRGKFFLVMVGVATTCNQLIRKISSGAINVLRKVSFDFCNCREQNFDKLHAIVVVSLGQGG